MIPERILAVFGLTATEPRTEALPFDAYGLDAALAQRKAARADRQRAARQGRGRRA